MKSIVNENRKGVCYLCKRMTRTEEHHIFGGNPGRKLSERYGLKVYLCPYCHRDNRQGVHGNPEKMERLHRIGQLAFEKRHTRAEFMEIFGKNYLEDQEDAGVKMQEPETPRAESMIGLFGFPGEPKKLLPGFAWIREDEHCKTESGGQSDG